MNLIQTRLPVLYEEHLLLEAYLGILRSWPMMNAPDEAVMLEDFPFA